MILYVDLRTGEVRDPAVGVVGHILGWEQAPRVDDRVAVYVSYSIELDDAKINQKRDRSVF